MLGCAGNERTAPVRSGLVLITHDLHVVELLHGDQLEDPANQVPGGDEDQVAAPLQALCRSDQDLDARGIHEREPCEVQREVSPPVDFGLDRLGERRRVGRVELSDQPEATRRVDGLDVEQHRTSRGGRPRSGYCRRDSVRSMQASSGISPGSYRLEGDCPGSGNPVRPCGRRTAMGRSRFLRLASRCRCSPCSAPPPSGIPHPTDPDQLVLRVEQVGGFISPAYLFTRVPMFSLFGDGSVITEGAQIEIYPQSALPPLLVQQLTPEGVQRLLELAREAGLMDKDAQYFNARIADAPT